MAGRNRAVAVVCLVLASLVAVAGAAAAAGPIVATLVLAASAALVAFASRSPSAQRRRRQRILGSVMSAKTGGWEPNIPVTAENGEHTVITFVGELEPPEPTTTSFVLVLEGTVRTDFDGRKDVPFGAGEMIVVHANATKRPYARQQAKVLVTKTLDSK